MMTGGSSSTISNSDTLHQTQHSTLPKEPNTAINSSSSTNSASSATTKWKTLPINAKFSSNRSSSLRRSFTIPRNLLTRKNGEIGPSSTNSNSNFVKNIFLSIVRPRTNMTSMTKTSATTNTDEDSADPTQALGGLVPAAVGLKNQGNTCYMNSILQCLSHTDVLAKFLVTDAYKRHLRKKLWSKERKGEVTEEFASILKSAWLRLSSSEEAATKFKTAVDRGAPQWRGSEEHDAQEFLLWMLDRLHEDLNQASTTKYKTIKKKSGKSEEEVAAEAVENWNRTNNSVIQEIFGAQFKSSLTCPGCGRQSATFEPFLTVSLPIPEAKEDLPLYVHVLYLNQQPRLVKLGLSLPCEGNVRDVREALANDTGVKEMLLLEIDGEGFHRTFTDSQPLSATCKNEALYAIETPEQTTESVVLLWVNVLVSEDTRVRFGSPYISQMSRETAYDDFQKLLLKEMSPILRAGVLVSAQKAGIFAVRIVDGSAEGTLVDPTLEHPLFTEAVEEALTLCSDGIVPHVKLLLEWKPEEKELLIADESETVEEHWSLGDTRAKHSAANEHSVALEECFDLYTGAEELSAEDSWHCPHCNRKEEGTLKMIGLWSAPPILVLHLKRFRQGLRGRGTVSKVSSLVDFPFESLNLTPHVTKKVRGDALAAAFSSAEAQANKGNCFGGWRQRASFKKLSGTNGYTKKNGYNHGPGEDETLLYDLFAVCNHHGKDLQGGHYTAYCRNPVERKWWAFDDTRVRQVDGIDEIKSSAAYILFYQRKQWNDEEGQWFNHFLRKHPRTNEIARKTVIGDDNGTAINPSTNSIETSNFESSASTNDLNSQNNNSTILHQHPSETNSSIVTET